MTLIFINRDVYMWVVLNHLLCIVNVFICVSCANDHRFLFQSTKEMGETIDVSFLLLLKKSKNRTQYGKIYHLNIHTFYTRVQNRFVLTFSLGTFRSGKICDSVTFGLRLKSFQLTAGTMNRMRSFYELIQCELLSHSHFLWDDFRMNKIENTEIRLKLINFWLVLNWFYSLV